MRWGLTLIGKSGGKPRLSRRLMSREVAGRPTVIKGALPSTICKVVFLGQGKLGINPSQRIHLSKVLDARSRWIFVDKLITKQTSLHLRWRKKSGKLLAIPESLPAYHTRFILHAVGNDVPSPFLTHTSAIARLWCPKGLTGSVSILCIKARTCTIAVTRYHVVNPQS